MLGRSSGIGSVSLAGVRIAGKAVRAEGISGNRLVQSSGESGALARLTLGALDCGILVHRPLSNPCFRCQSTDYGGGACSYILKHTENLTTLQLGSPALVICLSFVSA